METNIISKKTLPFFQTFHRINYPTQGLCKLENTLQMETFVGGNGDNGGGGGGITIISVINIIINLGNHAIAELWNLRKAG